MTTYIGTSGNDSWTVVNPGTFMLDGLGGTDTLYLGTSLRSSYTITQGADGAVHVDTLSGASGVLHATLVNMETLVFNSGRDIVDLTTYFLDTTPPTVKASNDAPAIARGNITYALSFSEGVSGLAASDFSVLNGSVVSVSGSGASYQVVVAPSANTEGALVLTLKAGAVADAAGNANAAAASAPPQPIDTKAPQLLTTLPIDGAKAVQAGSDLLFNFSEAIQRGSGSIVLRDGAGVLIATVDVANSAALGFAGSMLTVHTGTTLAAGTSYSLTLSPGSVTDLAGNPYGGSGVGRFSTAIDPNNPSFTGTSGNDIIVAIPGREAIDGGAGIDKVLLALGRSAYTLVAGGSGFTAVAADGSGSYALKNIERLQFADGQLALDLGGNAGTIAKILGAVYGPAAVANRAYVGVGLQLLDGSMSDEALMQLALNAKLGPDASHAQVVNLLFTNVVGTAPTAEDAAYFVGLLDSHALTPAAMAIAAANTALNLAHIDLVGLAQNGLPYDGG
ncbi:MAG: Ig-like domain-containing protein [Burkholderiales bacterium]|nr:Ig-like domain-containing protein [Burkholderiales bacterium]